MPKRTEINKGDKFGNWEVLEELPIMMMIAKKRIDYRRTFLCKCDCGVTKHIVISQLLYQTSKNCRKCRRPSENALGIRQYHTAKKRFIRKPHEVP